jgi:tight adherence protein C
MTTFSPSLAFVALMALLTACSIAALLFQTGVFGLRRLTIARLRDLASDADTSQGKRTATKKSQRRVWPLFSKVGDCIALWQKIPLGDLQTRMNGVGIANANAASVFIGCKAVFAVVGAVVAVGLMLVVGAKAFVLIVAVGVAGMLAGALLPDALLERWGRARQRTVRHSLPDALDLMVLCMEGGMTLDAALQCATDELASVHPVLCGELERVQREVQMGIPVGESLKSLAERLKISELRDLAAVVNQSTRFGVGAAKALRCYADAARVERQGRLEENAQKAAVKILFPTLLFIFPAIFVVLLGPAAFQISKMFTR